MMLGAENFATNLEYRNFETKDYSFLNRFSTESVARFLRKDLFVKHLSLAFHFNFLYFIHLLSSETSDVNNPVHKSHSTKIKFIYFVMILFFILSENQSDFNLFTFILSSALPPQIKYTKVFLHNTKCFDRVGVHKTRKLLIFKFSRHF